MKYKIPILQKKLLQGLQQKGYLVTVDTRSVWIPKLRNFAKKYTLVYYVPAAVYDYIYAGYGGRLPAKNEYVRLELFETWRQINVVKLLASWLKEDGGAGDWMRIRTMGDVPPKTRAKREIENWDSAIRIRNKMSEAKVKFEVAAVKEGIMEFLSDEVKRERQAEREKRKAEREAEERKLEERMLSILDGEKEKESVMIEEERK